ncbi:hypothetical protein XELAEV_18003969mg [Xenopus laevis]|uniref:Uncharacterized protein n=1 Tax=Xenopus laevis TaxID=8355 RepID=A0A974GY51_XENLA|nr:hypothetical protein XELAEV_18003969mg [Xenopus laevis]
MIQNNPPKSILDYSLPCSDSQALSNSFTGSLMLFKYFNVSSSQWPAGQKSRLIVPWHTIVSSGSMWSLPPQCPISLSA